MNCGRDGLHQRPLPCRANWPCCWLATYQAGYCGAGKHRRCGIRPVDRGPAWFDASLEWLLTRQCIEVTGRSRPATLYLHEAWHLGSHSHSHPMALLKFVHLSAGARWDMARTWERVTWTDTGRPLPLTTCALFAARKWHGRICLATSTYVMSCTCRGA